MKPLTRIAAAMFAADRAAFLRGAALGVVVLAMGAALLGLSGWFVTACAAAGIAGVGIGFDFFRPSAGVRFLALGRAGARYGERMLTHDATLRALSAVRVRLYRGVARLPWEAQTRLRGAEALNRLTSDVDALDGLLLRLVLPAISVVAVLAGTLALLWWLTAPAVAVAVVAASAFGGAISLWRTARHARAAAEEAETALQTLRARALDLAQSRADLTVAGALARQQAAVEAAIAAEVAARNRVERAERAGGLSLSLTTGLAAAAALAVGGALAQQGAITAAEAAIGFFVAVALGEGPMLLRRGLAELGRMQVAGGRVDALSQTPETFETRYLYPTDVTSAAQDVSDAEAKAAHASAAPPVAAEGLGFTRPGAMRATFGPIGFSVDRGQSLLISGPSGAGKSTLLAVLAGLIAPSTGRVLIQGLPLAQMTERDLRASLRLVPQRSALVAGTLRENLALGVLPLQGEDPARGHDDRMWELLEAMRLDADIRARGGLDMRLGPGGSGLSGGQARRVTLARALMQPTGALLLDEPTEGLDAETAVSVLGAIRHLARDSALIYVSHHPADRAFADREIAIWTGGDIAAM